MPVPADERISVGARMKRGVYASAVRERDSGVSAGRGLRRTGRARMDHHGLWRGRGARRQELSEVLAWSGDSNGMDRE
jgi:hypothetical protein